MATSSMQHGLPQLLHEGASFLVSRPPSAGGSPGAYSRIQLLFRRWRQGAQAPDSLANAEARSASLAVNSVFASHVHLGNLRGARGIVDLCQMRRLQLSPWLVADCVARMPPSDLSDIHPWLAELKPPLQAFQAQTVGEMLAEASSVHGPFSGLSSTWLFGTMWIHSVAPAWVAQWLQAETPSPQRPASILDCGGSLLLPWVPNEGRHRLLLRQSLRLAEGLARCVVGADDAVELHDLSIQIFRNHFSGGEGAPVSDEALVRWLALETHLLPMSFVGQAELVQEAACAVLVYFLQLGSQHSDLAPAWLTRCFRSESLKPARESLLLALSTWLCTPPAAFAMRHTGADVIRPSAFCSMFESLARSRGLTDMPDTSLPQELLTSPLAWHCAWIVFTRTPGRWDAAMQCFQELRTRFPAWGPPHEGTCALFAMEARNSLQRMERLNRLPWAFVAVDNSWDFSYVARDLDDDDDD